MRKFVRNRKASERYIAEDRAYHRRILESVWLSVVAAMFGNLSECLATTEKYLTARSPEAEDWRIK